MNAFRIEPPAAPSSLGLRRDIALVGAFTLVVVMLAAHFEWSERLYATTRRWESIQLDEWPIAAFALALGFSWLSWRRYLQERELLHARREAEQQLARALAENRRLAQHHLRVTEQDRKHLARELHDELGQYSNAIKLDAVTLLEDEANEQRRSSAGRIVAAVDHMHAIINDIIRRLRPPGLDELGLIAALENCIQQWRQRRPAMQFSLQTRGALDEAGETIRLTIYRIVQEALTNSARHAAARHVDVLVCRDPQAEDPQREFLIRVTDDGQGIDLEGFLPGFGLGGMRERAELLGGSLNIQSARRRGFTIEALLSSPGEN